MFGRIALCACFAVAGLCLAVLFADRSTFASELASTEYDLEVFVREGCPHCTAAKVFLEQLGRDRPGLRMIIRDVGADRAALARLKDLASRRDMRTLGVPAFYLRGQLIIGYSAAETTGARIKALLDRPIGQIRDRPPVGACRPEEDAPCEDQTVQDRLATDSIETRWFGRLSVRELGLPVFTLAIGLLDGLNPCAMWVLLFLLSLLVHLRSRAKMALIAGTFVFVSGLTYFAFMAAWLNVFLWIGITRSVQLLLGVVAGAIGIINVKDFFVFRRGLSLVIPERAKPRLYKQARAVLQAENFVAALTGIVVLAVLVNAVELLCTAGFPALYTEILTLRRLPWWQYYAYLGLYNVAYMFDDALMVGIAVVTLSHHQLQAGGARWLKLISGLVMIGLGSVLLMHPDWLVG
jgi:glutaredoxin